MSTLTSIEPNANDNHDRLSTVFNIFERRGLAAALRAMEATERARRIVAEVNARFGLRAEAAYMFADQRLLVAIYEPRNEDDADFELWGGDVLEWWLAAHPRAGYADLIAKADTLAVTHPGVIEAWCGRDT
jgi:hypothetical protein